ncbi:sensor histidine kinase [Nonomuraea gerenzanensis]|uniref:histidine kinase n=1 Tax=Nonomuraea gerenzanensis TaxID=93944 RepID=A0A1M4DYE6_9ACTN|nr:sensor histidine kinase [Nonomuraea gerenzanensis]UBU13917.1 sensor histidine kinase [Nonomuraea gerenzanensis]SBO91599.1 putative signal transduction histidine kinase [Nonomuraea gerenzanensis]
MTALVLLLGYALVDPPGPSSWLPPWAAWPVAAAMSLPVAFRRRWPQAMLITAATAAVLATAAGAVAAGAIWIFFIPAALTLYLVATTTPPARSAAFLAGCLSGAAVAVLVFYTQVLPTLPPALERTELPPYWPVEGGTIGVFMSAAWGIGVMVRRQRGLVARLAHHRAEAAVADERRRIARELHDIIGHSMSVIAVKATVANHVADLHPQEVRAAMTVIEQTSQSTLTEIRRVLGLLRSDGDPHDSWAPVPGLADLSDLARQATSAGVDVNLHVPTDAALPSAVALSAYRIVQEALTNVVKHAAPTRCSVTVTLDSGQAVIEVRDSGPRTQREPRPTSLGGHGLIGMRERATMFGGTLTAGPHTDGGFHVVARLPYGPVDAAA